MTDADDDDVVVTLSWSEVAWAAREGCQRAIRAMSKGRVRPGSNKKRRGGRWDHDVEAACAEVAVAKHLRAYWAPDPALDYAGDIGGGWHVRSTDLPKGCLIVYREDPDDGKFALAVGTVPTFRLPGWIVAADAKRTDWWESDKLDRPGFMVPQTELAGWRP